MTPELIDRNRVFSPADAYMSRAMDSKLVAAVQRLAGARCHRAANLLNCYGLCFEAYRQAQEAEIAKATRELDDSEVNLRKFLFQCRFPRRAVFGLPDNAEAWANAIMPSLHQRPVGS